jgi:hypothetical protein
LGLACADLSQQDDMVYAVSERWPCEIGAATVAR